VVFQGSLFTGFSEEPVCKRRRTFIIRKFR
jgi:hypothetical protein